MPGGNTGVENGTLEIDAQYAQSGSNKPSGPIIIEYEATMIQAGGPNDHARDLNCFGWQSILSTPETFSATTVERAVSGL